MEMICKIILNILEIMDEHEGAIALLGIAVTIGIFRKEVTNNYFTLERDNFNAVFQNLLLKKLPKCIQDVESATTLEWAVSFEKLNKVLNCIVDRAKYYKYSMPFFYNILKVRKEEIEDLVRHDEWRLYRNTVMQNELIEKKCRAIIRDINNASKGKTFRIKLYQNSFIQKIRDFFNKHLFEQPADRICETMNQEDCQGKIEIYQLVNCTFDNNWCKVERSECKNLVSHKIKFEVKENNLYIDQIYVIKDRPFFWGYKLNIRWGKKLGKIDIKADRDAEMKAKIEENVGYVFWNSDNFIHAVVIVWHAGDDICHKNFDTINIRYNGCE